MPVTSIGERVRESLPAHLSQRKLAPEVGMTHDALSRAINGQRHFSAIELAKLADVLGVDTHWLITGEQDPFKVRLVARHLWDQGSSEQDARDDEIITRVVETYKAAYAEGGRVPTSLTPLPAEAMRIRGLLSDANHGSGQAFEVRYLAEQIQNVLGIDIVRDPGLQTDYSFRIGDHAVVLLKSTVNWFRANWSIAHELGHLALGHHFRERTTSADEWPANVFASEFLLPEDMVRAVDWQNMMRGQLALWLWNAGVSTAALKIRLASLGISPSGDVGAALEDTTPRLMRAHVTLIRDAAQTHGDPIWERENATTGRQFPQQLVAALTARVEAGEVDPYLLAWVREVPVDDLAWPEPDVDEPSSGYAELASRTSETDWFGLLESQ
jgi:Zn-dependent peptidase ImmA (M78 family)/transcriptional regulator with XRE-family HTH domain